MRFKTKKVRLLSGLFFHAKLSLAQEAENVLRLLVRLREHRCARLDKNLVLREFDHFFRHVCVADAAFRSLQVFSADVQAHDCVLKAILISAEVCALLVDFHQSKVKRSNRAVRVIRSGQRNLCLVADVANSQGCRSHSSNVHLSALIHISTNMEPHRTSNNVFASRAREAASEHIHSVELSSGSDAVNFINE